MEAAVDEEIINMKKDLIKRRCNQCGSDLILVKTVVEDKNSPSPVTSLIYSCSDKSCQANINKKTIARRKYFKEQEKARINRYKSHMRG